MTWIERAEEKTSGALKSFFFTFPFRYLHLLTEEHAAIKKERALLESFELLETAEREAFYQLSNRFISAFFKFYYQRKR